MKVRNLIKKLEKMPQSADVIIYSDPKHPWVYRRAYAFIEDVDGEDMVVIGEKR
jgi:hypothetical protein